MINISLLNAINKVNNAIYKNYIAPKIILYYEVHM